MSTEPIVSISGEDAFEAPPEVIYDKISDAAFLMSCLGDYVGTVEDATRDRASWKMKIPIPLMSGEIDMEMTFLSRVEGSMTHVRIVGDGMGATGVVETINEVQPTPTGCTIKWSSNVIETTGMLKMVPAMVMEAGMRQAVAQSWTAIRAKLAEV